MNQETNRASDLWTLTVYYPENTVIITSSMSLFLFIIAFNCPENSVYDPCASGCPESCSSFTNSVFCNITCQETCACAEGLVRDGDRCVDPVQCGCTLPNDVYLPVSPSNIVHYIRSDMKNIFHSSKCLLWFQMYLNLVILGMQIQLMTAFKIVLITRRCEVKCH